MLDRVIAGPVPRVAEQCRRRVRTAERRVVADVDPGPRGSGLALGQHRHRRVIAVQTLRRQHMRRDPVVQRPQRHRAGAHLVGQGRQAEIDTFARVAIPLAVERLVLAVLLEDDHRQQVRARPAPGCRVERRRRLGDLLAMTAGELLAHRLDHLPAAWDDLQRLGHVLADLRQLLRAAAGGRMSAPAPPRARAEGAPETGRLATREPLDLRCSGRRQLVLGRAPPQARRAEAPAGREAAAYAPSASRTSRA